MPILDAVLYAPIQSDGLDDIYAALTPREYDVVMQSIDPQNASLTDDELASKLHLTPAQLVNIRRRPRVARAIAAGLASAVRLYVPQILKASLEVATKAGKDGFADRKLLLQIAGLLNQQQQPKTAAPAEQPVRIELTELPPPQEE